MIKLGKKLNAILLTALCCVFLFPVIAMAEEIEEVIEKPIVLPETMLIIKHMIGSTGELEPVEVTVKSYEDGRFSFDYPALFVPNMKGWGDNHTITPFTVEGKAIYRMDKERERKFGITSSRWIVGEFTVSDEIVYTFLKPSVSEDYSDVSKYVITPIGGTFETTSYDDDALEHSISFRLQFECTRYDTMYDDEGGSTTTQHTYEDTWSFTLETVGFTDPYPSSTTDTRQDTNQDTNQDSNQATNQAGPLATITISIIAILLAILFGNTGGFIPTMPVGTGGTPGSTYVDDVLPPTPADDGLSSWIRFDDDGDIEVTDPVNGQKRIFVSNGDGTYTDPITGATYTTEELSEQMEHRADNAGTIRQDEAQFERNVSEDSLRNRERSDESLQLEKDIREEREERSQREKIERMAVKLGISGADKKQVDEALRERQDNEEAYQEKMHDYARRRDIAVKTLEVTTEAADYAMSAGEALVPGGKTVSATYKGIKNVVSTVAEKGMSTGSVIEGVIKGGTEAATTVMDAGIGKAATAFGGTVAGEIAGAVNDGEDLGDAMVRGTVKGTFNAASNAVGDAYGDAMGGSADMLEDMTRNEQFISKAAEAAGKISETGFGKNVTDNVGKNTYRR
jgi:hypothetical protein